MCLYTLAGLIGQLENRKISVESSAAGAGDAAASPNKMYLTKLIRVGKFGWISVKFGQN